MIEVVNISKVFNKGRPNEHLVIREVSLTLPLGGVTVLKGPSGSGKTTLLGLLGCMARPTSGRIILSGREITSLPERFLTEIRRQTFGFIFQSFNLIRGLTALENVMVPGYPTGEPHQTLKRRALDLLDLFDLGPRAMSRVEWLSGGEAQRVAIARAMINGPTIIVADEPTAHLDSRLSAEFLAIVERLNLSGTTIIMASHDPLVYDAPVVTRLIEVRDGCIVPAGSVQ